jgi:CxxC-x17-CxxC domain-containing protein
MYSIARHCQVAEPAHPKGAVTMSADTTLTCRDCGQAFTFTSGEQDFYAARGYTEPTRCPDCRAARKSQREGGSSYGGGYGSSYGGGGGGGGGYGSGGRGPREMFTVTCSSCGKDAQVPFQPSNDKPVYCSECFQQRGGNNRGGYGGRSGGRSRY